MGKKILLWLFFASNISLLNAFVYPPDDDEELVEDSPPPITNLYLGAMPTSKFIAKEMKAYLQLHNINSKAVHTVVPVEASSSLMKMINNLLKKWEIVDGIDGIKIILVPKDIHISFKDRTLSLGQKIFDLFADEEIEAALNREFARHKKKHAQFEKPFSQMMAIILFFHLNMFDELMQGKIIGPGVFALWAILHFKPSLPPVSWLHQHLETEADSLGAIVGNTKNSISFLIKLYFYQNDCLSHLSDSLDENLNFIEHQEKNKFPMIEAAKLLMMDHKTPYARLQNVCDLYRQISSNKKSSTTLSQERYKKLSKYREWIVKMSAFFNCNNYESDKITI